MPVRTTSMGMLPAVWEASTTRSISRSWAIAASASKGSRVPVTFEAWVTTMAFVFLFRRPAHRRVELSGRRTRDDRQLDPLPFEEAQRPHHRIVLHAGSDDMVTRFQQPEKHAIDRLGGVLRKCDGKRVRRADKLGRTAHAPHRPRAPLQWKGDARSGRGSRRWIR